MNLLFWALTVSMVGKVLLAAGVLFAHHELAREQKIDSRVLRGFKLEYILTISGLILIIGGYFMEIYFYNLIDMLTCFSSECNLANLLFVK